MIVLVTGAAGFIGFHLSCRLLQSKIPVLGLDNLNSYYDPDLKRARLAELNRVAESVGTPFSLVEANLEDSSAVEKAFCGKLCDSTTFVPGPPSHVVNLAAQAGVRYSIENPT